jgi:hypothetical protein
MHTNEYHVPFLQIAIPPSQSLQALLFLFAFREGQFFFRGFLGDLRGELRAVGNELGPLLLAGRCGTRR